MIEIVPADYPDAADITMRMRDEDVRELHDLSGSKPWQAVREAIQLPGEAWIAKLDGVPTAIFGCAAPVVLGRRGSPWFLGTCDVGKAQRAMLRDATTYVQRWAASYSLLENVVDGRNVKTIRWLRALGFTFDEPFMVRPGVPAQRFWMKGL